MAVAAAQKNREMFAIKKSYSIENGYPARRRSLVDDARFETLVVKQTKQCVLDEARLRANDSGLTEEEVVLQNALAEGGPEAEQEIQKAAIVVHMRDGMNSLVRILKAIEKFHGAICHLETRQSRTYKTQFDLLVKVDMTRQSLLQLIRSLRQSNALEGVSLLAEDNISVKNPWFPRHASELDNCNHLMTKYEPELDMNHPGFADKEYRERRKQIAEIAFAFKYGDTIPTINYTESEIKTWGSVFNTVLDLMPKHACMEYRKVFAKLQEEGIFSPNKIPQLEEMSAFMRRETGFSLRPAAGLLTARDFLASLAFRIFQSTQYVRHENSPNHTPEPDCIHELLGHMPLLCDPSFAQFSQEIGLASLGASDDEIEKLSTVYWFTVEFGLCKEGGQVKAYGAGLLSSYGELLHALSDKPELRAFEPSKTAIQPYQDQEYQPIYYVAESFEDAKDKFRRWVATMSRPFEVRFNPHTGRVEVLDSVHRLEALVNQLNTEVLHLSNALTKLKSPSC
ncbi:tyrosine 3-monooxygenase isoform X2 [Chrysoperla carnea]|uniref:tyrosine 3-monooxygenase isoform X2 n=1 Tax=Chrysoperla carnea TaxID=189513 RepID=UPI001D084D07|nr:tyrosine 3-monooxygenase isoform X2 [Chrysoperla carnea]